MIENYLEQLNPAQRQAVEYIEGPSLVIAGAGSGKTRVLTYKVVHLINKGYHPTEILVLTFTNKAANEMRQRIEKMIGAGQAGLLWMGTFHSIFAKILRREAHHIGYPANYTIYDTIDSRNVIKQVIRELELNPKDYPVNLIHSRISRAKNNLITAEYYSQQDKLIQQDSMKGIPEFSRIFTVYQNKLRKAGAMDFDDLLLNINILFHEKPDVLEKYRNIFRFILVDEYQDTNYAQYIIIKKLAQDHGHICVVGDDAQSIYAFRGARIENILNFQRDFPQAKLFKLEQNYRSTKKIVNAANSVIAKNKMQIPKQVFSTAEEGEDILVVSHATDYEEGRWVAEEISRLKRRGIPLSEIAILYRMNFQSRIMEDFLRKRNIPYRIYGGISFYQRKEVKDILAYFRVVVNPQDDEALRRIINYPTRGIGSTTQKVIFEEAARRGLPVWKIIENLENLSLPLASRSINAVTKFRTLIESLRKKSEQADLYEFARTLVSSIGIIQDLEAEGSQEAKNRIENIMELLSAIKEFAGNGAEDDPITVDAFLQQVTLLTAEDTENNGDQDKVNVMTIHSAKGLEFHTVFLVGTEMGIFPSEMSKSDMKELEEERRLFYVAITRAKKQVYISYANSRKFWGRIEVQSPSPFIDEIDPALLSFKLHSDYSEQKVSLSGSSYQEFKRERNFTNPQPQTNPRRFNPKPDVSKMKKVSVKPASGGEKSIDYDPTTGLRVGMEVIHNKFGRGKILSMTGEYPNTKAEIEFEGLGVKKILLKFAKLQVVS